jgi:predicted Rossmann fold nucleotide-binding protein DprA/Smf involved in DNA uptake
MRAKRPLLALVGSVNIDHDQAFEIGNKAIKELNPRAIVSGGAQGVDTIAEELAVFWGLPCIVCKPAGRGWRYYEKRNRLIAEICDRLVRISSANTRTYGSGWTADRAEEMGKPVERYVVY